MDIIRYKGPILTGGRTKAIARGGRYNSKNRTENCSDKWQSAVKSGREPANNDAITGGAQTYLGEDLVSKVLMHTAGVKLDLL
jgi:hypothetical protein